MKRTHFALNWRTLPSFIKICKLAPPLKDFLIRFSPRWLIIQLCLPKWDHIFSSRQQAGINHLYDLFHKGEFVTFDKLASHFHIAHKKKKDFSKYLQVRHVSTRNSGLSNHFHFLRFFLLSAETQRFISKFYSLLYEHRKNK